MMIVGLALFIVLIASAIVAVIAGIRNRAQIAIPALAIMGLSLLVLSGIFWFSL